MSEEETAFMPPQQPIHEQQQPQPPQQIIQITVIVPPNVKVNIQHRSTNATPETETRQS